jgi:hypothetical protein
MNSPFAKKIFLLLAKLRARKITSRQIDVEVYKLEAEYGRGRGMPLLKTTKNIGGKEDGYNI